MYIKSNILEFLEEAAARFGEKTAYSNIKSTMSFAQTEKTAKAVGSGLTQMCRPNQPVALLMDKSLDHISAMFGAVYAGCFYVPLDYKMPMDRLQSILDKLQPAVVITEKKTLKAFDALERKYPSARFEDIVQTPVDEAKLAAIRENFIDTDLLYVIFTSGSTGTPKGVTISHRSIVRYVDQFGGIFGINENDVLANQAPLYFDMSICDVMLPIFTGCMTILTPRTCFLLPRAMVDFLNKNHVTAIQWTPSAMMNLSSSGILEEDPPKYLRWVVFGAEVLPTRQLNRWRRALGDGVRFCNGYGPTEASDTSTYYILDREFDDDEVIPLGRSMPNMRIMLLDEDNKLVEQGQYGEICITGNALSFGYYNDPERTAQAFVPNPFNPHYYEPMYRTGDLAYYNERGELVYVGRKDFQIKLRGYRIELGEIEHAAASAEGIYNVCCVFDKANERIICLYTGSLTEKAVADQIKSKVPHYMVPGEIIRLDSMPRTPNGKIDRVLLRKTYTE